MFRKAIPLAYIGHVASNLKSWCEGDRKADNDRLMTVLAPNTAFVQISTENDPGLFKVHADFGFGGRLSITVFKEPKEADSIQCILQATSPYEQPPLQYVIHGLVPEVGELSPINEKAFNATLDLIELKAKQFANEIVQAVKSSDRMKELV